MPFPSTAQVPRYLLPGERPAPGEFYAGTLAVNFHDGVLYCSDLTQTAQPIARSFTLHSPLKAYHEGDAVIAPSGVYYARADVAPGPFNPDDWEVAANVAATVVPPWEAGRDYHVGDVVMVPDTFSGEGRLWTATIDSPGVPPAGWAQVDAHFWDARMALLDTQLAQIEVALNNRALSGHTHAITTLNAPGAPANTFPLWTGSGFTMAPLASIGDAPVDNSTYGKRNGAWTRVANIIGDEFTGPVTAPVLAVDANLRMLMSGAVATFRANSNAALTYDRSSGTWGLSAAGDAVLAASNTSVQLLKPVSVPTPTLPGHAATKAYVDAAAGGAVTQAYVDAQDLTRVAKAGDTMTGALVLPADPTAAMHAATKQYVDARAAAGAGSRDITGVADTPTASDHNKVLYANNSGLITITLNSLPSGITYVVLQEGTGQVSFVAGAGVTLVSDKAQPQFKSARRGAVVTVLHRGATVFVGGNTAA